MKGQFHVILSYKTKQIALSPRPSSAKNVAALLLTKISVTLFCAIC